MDGVLRPGSYTAFSRAHGTIRYETIWRFPATRRCASARLAGLRGLQCAESVVRQCSAGSLSAGTITFAEVQQGFVLTVNGSQFVSSSVGVVNGTTLSTLVTSSTQLQFTITTALISAPGKASVTVNTPSGNSGDLGCSSGGTSSALVLNIT